MMEANAEKEEKPQKVSPALVNPQSFHNTTDNDALLRASTGSPESFVPGELPIIIPDITMLCEECEGYVDIGSLQEHRYYHKCLNIMKYKNDTKPENVEKLMIRRKNLIRLLKQRTDGGHIDGLELQRINEAYEFLKADVEDTYVSHRRIPDDVDISVQGVGLSCSTDSAIAVGICSHGNSRWKRVMEDTKVFQDRYGNDVHKCYFGIYDGHHGHFASELTASELHHILLMEMAKFDPQTVCLCDDENYFDKDLEFCEIHSHSVSFQDDEEYYQTESAVMLKKIIADYGHKVDKLMKNYKKSRRKKPDGTETFDDKMKESLIRAHYIMDMLLSWGKEEYSKVRWSGCSALSCVISDNINQGNTEEGQKNEEGKKNEEGTECQDEGEAVKEKTVDTDRVEQEVEDEKDEPSAELMHLGNIYIANAGNVRGILVRGNEVYSLTQLHKGTNESEAARIKKEGGRISQSQQECKVNGVLTATRGLGNHGDPLLRKCVIARPHTTVVKIDQYAQFLILASHGVWEHFSEAEAASILLQMLPTTLMADVRPGTSIYELLADLGSQFLSKTQTGSLQVTDRQKSANSQMTKKTQPGSRKSSFCTDDERLTDDEVSRYNEDLESARALQAMSRGNENASDDGSDSYGDNLSIASEVKPHIITKEEIQRDFARALSERLTQAALLAGAKDNITVMVVLLPGCGL